MVITSVLLIRMLREDEALELAFGEEWLDWVEKNEIISRRPSKAENTHGKPSLAAHGTSQLAPIFNQERNKTLLESSPDATQKRGFTDDTLSGPSSKRNKHVHFEAAAPLAEKLRPETLSDFVGQSHLTNADSLLSKLSSGTSAVSIVFWGPPGCGKTTLARLIANEAKSIFKELSATNAGLNDGHIQVIGATTENPSFRLTGALLSRCRVFVLERLTEAEIKTILCRAIKRLEVVQSRPHESSNLHSQPASSNPRQEAQHSSHSDLAEIPCAFYPQVTAKILTDIASLAGGDARVALSLLELSVKTSKHITEKSLLEALKQSVSTSYNRTGESHYDMISALHKSVRGSQGSAALYWLARMLTAGEDPMYIARRMVVCASEDIGLADNHALPLAMAALQACQTIGMPECRINLAHLVAYLAEAPKSTRAYEAYNRAEAAAKLDLTIPVPMSMRNAPTELMKDLGYGKTYMYNPTYVHPVHNTYLPIQFEGEAFLRREGDNSDKIWDEEALRHWEHEANGDKDWEGRLGPLIDTFLIPMPTISKDLPDDTTFRVLVTGFGPFHQHEVNPSWLAVKPLHNIVISPDFTATGTHGHPRPIHISALEIPVSYDAVLAIVPGLHARPPIVAPTVQEQFSSPPTSGYDFILHIGVAGRGPLRMERQGHKLGYHMKDADGKLAPLARSTPKDFSRRPDDHLAAENTERERLGMEMVEHIGSDNSARPTRGFGVQYESFPDELPTEIDVTRLVQDLKQSGIEQIYTSMDAGHYLCDFIYFCSLAEAKRTANPYERRRNSQVLFLHCPPVNQPLSTEDVTEAIKRIIIWIQDEENANAEEAGSVTASERSEFLKQKGVTIWLTGLSASGKIKQEQSTIACALEQHLLHLHKYVYRLDGDNIRFGLNKDLGFDEKSRNENIRRIGEVAKLFADSACIVITAFISPYIADRAVARELHAKAGIPFIEVFVDAPLGVVEARDPKGLYKKARAGEIKEFTGISAPYEVPENPEVHIKTHETNIAQSVQIITEYLVSNNYLS
ncbi:hypothetical protein H0H93_008621 [Arthromyces matolae]|nr:hypothetical protein H0H93_008621 [Arthromyces matolae]